MSTTVISRGFIAALRIPLTEEEKEKFWDGIFNHHFRINNDGTLVYSDVNHDKSYSESEFQGDLTIIGHVGGDMAEFLTSVREQDFDIDANFVKPYVCVWYNGTDCPITEISFEDFKDM